MPSVATIWRILTRRGFVTPQPQKRPRSSFIRFCAQMPNERWQADITHWSLADETEVEILNVIDDHSRFLVDSDARVVFKAADVVASFHGAAAANGFPASVLTDNGAVWCVPLHQCVVNTPLRCPSRATILTGQYAHHTGVQDNGTGRNLKQFGSFTHRRSRRTIDPLPALR